MADRQAHPPNILRTSYEHPTGQSWSVQAENTPQDCRLVAASSEKRLITARTPWTSSEPSEAEPHTKEPTAQPFLHSKQVGGTTFRDLVAAIGMLFGLAPQTTHGAHGRARERVIAVARQRRSLLGVAAAVLVLGTGADARAADAQGLIREILGSEAYQCDLPGSALPTDQVAAEGLCAEPLADEAGRPDSLDTMRPSPWDIAEPPEPASTIQTGQIARILLWALIITGVALIAMEVARRLTFGGGRQGEPTLSGNAGSMAGAASADPTDADLDLAAAEALADAGAWSTAIHTLLLAAVLRLPDRLGNAFPESWTGRELLDRVAMPEDPAADLAHLVRASEAVHFAGRPASQSDYAHCRQRYRQFLQWARAN